MMDFEMWDGSYNGSEIPDPEKIKQELLEALGAGNVKRAKDLIECMEDLNQPLNAAYSPLILAVHKSLPEIVSLLLAKGADVNCKNTLGDTALICAVALKPNPSVIEILIRYGADVDVTDRFGRSLHSYVEDNKAVKKLLKDARKLKGKYNNLSATKSSNACVTQSNQGIYVFTAVDDALAKVVKDADINKLREFFDAGFYAGNIINISGNHLKIALDKKTNACLRLLLIRGGSLTEHQFESLPAEQAKAYKVAVNSSGLRFEFKIFENNATAGDNNSVSPPRPPKPPLVRIRY